MHLTLSLLVACATIVSSLSDAYVGQDDAGNLHVNATEGRAVFVNGVDVQAMQMAHAALSSTQVSTQAALSSTASTLASTLAVLSSMQSRIQALESPAKVGRRELARER